MPEPLLDHVPLAGNLDYGPSRPSIYELLAADELRDLVQPAFKYLLAYCAQRYPRHLLRLVNRHEEVYAAILLLVEQHHLIKYNASFSDHFYNLRLQPLPSIPTPRQDLLRAPGSSNTSAGLNRRQKWVYLGFLVGIPYVRSKAHALFESLGGGVDPELASRREDDIPPDTPVHPSPHLSTQSLITPPQRQYTTSLLQSTYLHLYPILSLSFDVWMLYWDLSYAFERTSWRRPWERIVGVVVERDVGGMAPPAISPTTLSTHSLPIRTLLTILLTLRSLLRLTIHNSLPISLLTLKFLQWWYSPSSPRGAISGSRRTGVGVGKGLGRVGPPKMIPPMEEGGTAKNARRIVIEAKEMIADGGDDNDSDSDSDLDSDLDSDSNNASSASSAPPATPPTKPTIGYGTCPICLQPWANASLLSTGYVGCYLCLYDAVKANGKCPVTGLDLIGGVEDIRKVLP